jgi:hypothetical protein
VAGVFKGEVTLLQAIQPQQTSTDQIHTEVLKAILYLLVEVSKDPVQGHHTGAPHQVAADHTAEAGNQEALILQDLRPALLQVLHLEEAVLLQEEEEVLLQAGVSLKQ